MNGRQVMRFATSVRVTSVTRDLYYSKRIVMRMLKKGNQKYK